MRRIFAVSLFIVSRLATASLAVAQTCAGDCDGDHRVMVDELVTGVNIVLGAQSVLRCASFDTNRDRRVAVNELIAGVNGAISGCPFPQRIAYVTTTDFQTGAFGTV